MTHKYTQGPWKAVFKHGQSGPDYYNIFDNDGVKLCEVLDTSTADLIAAAPDMLEALEGFVSGLAMNEGHPLMVAAVAAIKKAKGYPADGVRGDIAQ